MSSAVLLGATWSLLAAAAATAASPNTTTAIAAAGTNFTLTGDDFSYLFHVDPVSGDLVSDHFGAAVPDFTPPATLYPGGWVDGLSLTRREFPDVGRGDFRLPAIHIRHADGDTVSAFAYRSHEVVAGKPALPGLPATYGGAADVSTLIVTLYDNYSDVTAALSYSVFPAHNAIARSVQITNNGTRNISVERAASFSVDLPNLELDMLALQGDWAHESNRVRRRVAYGETGFRSTTGYSSHLHSPFFALLDPATTETEGEAWGFHLVYSGSFEATAERFSHGFVRVLLGLNPLHASIPVAPGATFTSPEAVAVYSSAGTGAMSRSFHALYTQHLSRSHYTNEQRPVLLNSWEGSGFDYNESSILALAGRARDLGVDLFVNDDGWFGVAYPRDNDTMGLGDWSPNPAKFPDGLRPYASAVTNMTVVGSSRGMRFGLWVEPEMVNPNSTLYREHPDWALHAGAHARTLTRNQLVLDLGRSEVQDFVFATVSGILRSAPIGYIKWDNNRGMHELPSPAAAHAYMLGLYSVVDRLTAAHPDVLWEGCASGGGRLDAGLLHYWPQHWASDDTDAAERLRIQMGDSLALPPAALACHVSAVPNEQTHRNISLAYRARVATMCGSFGFELDPSALSAADRAALPALLADARAAAPLVLHGAFHRLAWPDESNWPAVQFVAADGTSSLVLAFQQSAAVRPAPPPLRLRGLDPAARYANTLDHATYAGATYLRAGLNLPWERDGDGGDYASRAIWLYRVDG